MVIKSRAQRKPFSPVVTKSRCNTPTIKKPVKPRCGYNFFYRAQRKVLFEAFSKENPQLTETVQQFMNVEENGKRRREHKKTHGLIHLHDLTKIIAKMWNQASPEEKSIYKAEADKDKLRYKMEMEAYMKLVKSGVVSEIDVKSVAKKQPKKKNKKKQQKTVVKTEVKSEEDMKSTSNTKVVDEYAPVPFECVSDSSIEDLLADESVNEFALDFLSTMSCIESC